MKRASSGARFSDAYGGRRRTFGIVADFKCLLSLRLSIAPTVNEANVREPIGAAHMPEEGIARATPSASF
jgi:hypothetical protein